MCEHSPQRIVWEQRQPPAQDGRVQKLTDSICSTSEFFSPARAACMATAYGGISPIAVPAPHNTAAGVTCTTIMAVAMARPHVLRAKPPEPSSAAKASAVVLLGTSRRSGLRRTAYYTSTEAGCQRHNVLLALDGRTPSRKCPRRRPRQPGCPRSGSPATATTCRCGRRSPGDRTSPRPDTPAGDTLRNVSASASQWSPRHSIDM